LSSSALILGGLLLSLTTGVAVGWFGSKPKLLFRIPVVTAMLANFFSILLLLEFFQSGSFFVFGQNFVIDALSLFHVLLVNAVFLAAAIYALDYFAAQIDNGEITASYARRYVMLWQLFHLSLLFVLISNHIGLMWVALEATTIVSAFLIISDANALSIEAMWKYLLICSIGIGFAFLGTIVTIAATKSIAASENAFLFSQLIKHAHSLDPKLMLLAFIFIVVGFGTKAGLAPMHTWLPDAHSQAPTPVSAVFSGVMLNCALFGILRYLPIVEAARDYDGQARGIVLILGFISLLIAAVFIPVQHDVKRMLAYHSVEHIGIIAIGLGLGGAGVFAALFHTLNHSLAKVLAFFAAGQISNNFRTKDMRKISAVVSKMPAWGTAFLISIFALIGVAPFAVFMSEFQIARTAFFQNRLLVVAFFLLGTIAIFISASQHVLKVAFGAEASGGHKSGKVSIAEWLLILGLIIPLVLLGLWLPAQFTAFLAQAALIVEKGISFK
jgi:hydrogenase-4 component F